MCEDIMTECDRVLLDIEKLSVEDDMRRLTDEESRWIGQFDYTYNRKRTDQRSYKSDASRGVRVGSVEDLEKEPKIVDLCVDAESSVTSIMRRITPRQKNVPYNPRDYWAMPEIWYTKNWVDRVIDHVDRCRDAKEDTGIPGILIVDNGFQVNSFFEQKKVCLGIYSTLEEAKKVLKKYNQTVTTRGYGVDYE